MHKLKAFLVTWALTLLLFGLAAPQGGEAQSPMPQVNLPPPEMGPFIDIWTNDPVDNTTPDVAFAIHHGEFLVTWQNEHLAMTDIYARRVAEDGSLKSWFSVISTPWWNQGPAIAYTPMQDIYLIAYDYSGPPPNTTSDVRGRFVGWDGGYLFPEMPIRVESGTQYNAAVAYNSQDDEFLVVYENWWANGLRDIAAQRIKASTGALASWRNIATGTGEWRFDPSVAYNEARNEYLITYTHSPSASQFDGDILGKVATANLGVLSSEIQIASGARDQRSSTVAAGPDEYLVVWSDGDASTNDYDLYGRRVSGEGIPLGSPGGFVISSSTATNRREDPDVAFDGRCGYLVAWSYAEGGSPGWPPSVQDVYGARVAVGQDSIAGSEFAIDDGSALQSHPAVACSPWGQCLVVEQDKWSPASNMGWEIRGRMVMLNCPHQVYLPLLLRNAP